MLDFLFVIFALHTFGGRVIASFTDVDVAHFSIVKGLVGVLILETEPGLVIGTFLQFLTACVKCANCEQNTDSLTFQVVQFEFNLPVVINLQFFVSEIVQELKASELVARFIDRVDGGHNRACVCIDNVAFGIILGDVSAEKGVVCH